MSLIQWFMINRARSPAEFWTLSGLKILSFHWPHHTQN